jgi:hypothetical protein
MGGGRASVCRHDDARGVGRSPTRGGGARASGTGAMQRHARMPSMPIAPPTARRPAPGTAAPFAPRPTRRSRVVRLSLVVALHLLAYALVQRHYAPKPRTPPVPHHATVRVVLLPLPAPTGTVQSPPASVVPTPTPTAEPLPTPLPLPPREPPAAKATGRGDRPPVAVPLPPARGGRPITAAPSAAGARATAEPAAPPPASADDRTAAAPPDDAASRPPAPPSLLDTEASRRAIRASARTPSAHGALAAARSEAALPSAEQRLGAAIRSAGKGDCAEGEFAGAGMGLLSVPFLGLAVARGDCAQ